jgi:hypothetical protein
MQAVTSGIFRKNLGGTEVGLDSASPTASKMDSGHLYWSPDTIRVIELRGDEEEVVGTGEGGKHEGTVQNQVTTSWPESASELHRPSGRRLTAK